MPLTYSRRFSCAGWPEPRSKSSWIVHENREMIGRRGVPQKFRGAKDARHDAPTSPSRISGKCENVAVFLYKNFNRYLHSDTQTLGLDLEAKRLEPLDRVSKDT